MQEENKKIDNESDGNKKIFSFNELLIILGFSLFLGISHNYLLYGFSNGIGNPIFAILIIISMFIISNLLRNKLNKGFYIIAISIFIFSLFKIIRVGNILNVLNTISIYLLSLLLFIYIIKGRFDEIKIIDYMPGFIKTLFSSITGIGLWLGSFLKLGIKFPSFDNKTNIIKGVFMTLPVVFVFSLLFSSADLVFKNFISSIFNFDILRFINFSGEFINILFFTFFFLGLFTFSFYSIRTDKKKEEKEIIYDDKKHIEINIVLGMLSILFFIFVFFQIGYLFSGEASFIADGYTYSDYARKGFVELAFTALLVFILLWKIDDYLYSHKIISSSSLYKGLSSFLIFLTIVILSSAYYRLYLYEGAYGFTEIRFYGYVFIFVLLSALLSTLYKILFFINEGLFIIINIFFYFIGLFISNIINPESFVTNHNLNKEYRDSLSMDFSYIQDRSADAVDKMLLSYDKMNPQDREELESNLCRILRISKERQDDWRKFNYSYYYAYKLLNDKSSILNCKKNIFINIKDPEALNNYIKENGYDEVVYYYEGNRLYNEGKYKEAISSYNQGLSINPRFEKIYLDLGNSYFKDGNKKDGYKSYLYGISICTSNCDTLIFNMGYEKFKEGNNYEEALTYFTKALISNPYNKEALKYQIYSLYYLKKYTGVVAAYEDYKDNIDLKDFYTQIYLLDSYVQLGRYQNALTLINTLGLLPGNNINLVEQRQKILNKITNLSNSGSINTKN